MLEELVKAKEEKQTIRFAEPPAHITAQLNSPDKMVVTVPRSKNQDLIILNLDKGEFFIGRSEEGVEVDINLVPYGASRLGVSRKHARIFFSDNTWMVEDLGSTNGSYLNRRHMTANTPNIIRHGDELVFGKMLVQVYFSFDASTAGF
ncbi:MAG: FHA domain-containing protein [Anaerolineae bacterium]|nr:FHA domain-containing protein [Anaerolineae bacterium]